MSRLLMLTVLLLCFFTGFPAAQEQRADEGSITSLSGNTAVVHFERMSPGVGDEIVFIRRTEIVDPVSLKVRGATESEVGYGIVEDVGLGKTSVNIISLSDGVESLEMTDRVRLTGREKKIVRRNRVVGRIQELVDEDEIAIDVGSDDEISEGDMFLIQRTEMTYDPDTNEVTGQQQIEVGRGKVNSVSDKTSKGDIQLNPGIELNLETDDVVFEPTVIQEDIPPGIGEGMNERIINLEHEVASLRAAVDSLSREQQNQREAFRLFQSDMAHVVTMLQSPERDGVTIRLRNDETFPVEGQLPADYKHALSVCLKGEFDEAITLFNGFLEKYPEIALSENCRYWIGQSYYSKGEYQSAVEWFRSVKNNTGFVHKDDDASIMLGITYYLMGDQTAALDEFRYFMSNYADSEYRDKVERWVQRLS